MKLIQILKNNALPSLCSSNSQVIEILFKFCKFHNVPLLVESTSNQGFQTVNETVQEDGSIKLTLQKWNSSLV